MNRLDNIDIKPGDVVIDCGANIGDVTQYFYDRGAKVYAFEPNPYAYNILYKRFENIDKVVCIKKAVSDFDGKGKLFFHDLSETDPVKYSTGSSMVEDKNNVNSSTYEEVEIISLSRFITELSENVKVLKIDIEGEEHKVLNQMIDNGVILSIPYIFVETHEKKVPSCRPGLLEVRRKIEIFELSNIDLDWI